MSRMFETPGNSDTSSDAASMKQTKQLLSGGRGRQTCTVYRCEFYLD